MRLNQYLTTKHTDCSEPHSQLTTKDTVPPKRATEHKLETPEVPVAKPADRSVLSVGGGGVPDSEAELERLSVQSSSRPRDTFDINVARRNPKPVALSRKDLKKIPFSSNGDSEDDEEDLRLDPEIQWATKNRKYIRQYIRAIRPESSSSSSDTSSSEEDLPPPPPKKSRKKSKKHSKKKSLRY